MPSSARSDTNSDAADIHLYLHHGLPSKAHSILESSSARSAISSDAASIHLYLHHGLPSKTHSILEPHILHHNINHNDGEGDGVSDYPPLHHHHPHHDTQSGDYNDYMTDPFLFLPLGAAMATAASSAGDYFSGAPDFVTSSPKPLQHPQALLTPDNTPFPSYATSVASLSPHHRASPGSSQRPAYHDSPHHSYSSPPSHYPLAPPPPPLPPTAAAAAEAAAYHASLYGASPPHDSPSSFTDLAEPQIAPDILTCFSPPLAPSPGPSPPAAAEAAAASPYHASSYGTSSSHGSPWSFTNLAEPQIAPDIETCLSPPLAPSPGPSPAEAAAAAVAMASFPCDHPSCTKAFARLCDLRRHKKRHQKRHRCRASAECDSLFHSERDRGRHERSVHRRDEHLVCSVCGHRTARKDNMRSHIRRRHGEERVDEVMAAVMVGRGGMQCGGY